MTLDTSALADLIRELGVTVVPFGESEWRCAIDAFARYGRGRHKASLNDFRHTDVRPAI